MFKLSVCQDNKVPRHAHILLEQTVCNYELISISTVHLEPHRTAFLFNDSTVAERSEAL